MTKELFEIDFRWSWKRSISVLIECDPSATRGVKLGFAAKVAIDTGADLSGAILTGANLSGAILTGADLSGARLCNALGNGAHIRTIQTDRWVVVYTSEVIQIGCEHHAIADWWGFDDEQIAAMDRNALEWWRRWRPILQKIIETAPAVPTKVDQSND